MLGIGHTRLPAAPAAQHGHTQADPHQARSGIRDGPVADQAERCGHLGAVLRLQPEHGAVEQGRLVEPVEGLGQRDVVDVIRCPSGIDRRRLPAGAGSKSDTQLVASAAPVRQKKTAVPSGAATAARSASAGPRLRWQQRGEQGLGPGRCRRGVVDLQPDRGHRGAARTLLRGVLARGALRALISTQAPPFSQRWTGFVRCIPVFAKPRAARVSAISARLLPRRRPVRRTRIRSAVAADRGPSARSRSRASAGSRSRVSSPSARSERCASIAARSGSDWRKTSLKTSSDSGPRYPAAST